MCVAEGEVSEVYDDVLENYVKKTGGREEGGEARRGERRWEGGSKNTKHSQAC